MTLEHQCTTVAFTEKNIFQTSHHIRKKTQFFKHYHYELLNKY